MLDALLPSRQLWTLSTRVGETPFASLMREPESYKKFDKVILTQTRRKLSELGYGKHLANNLPNDPLVGEKVARKFRRYATKTRESLENIGRITDLIESGKVLGNLALPTLDPTEDRVMICRSTSLNIDLKTIPDGRGFTEGANSRPGEYVIKKAFVR